MYHWRNGTYFERLADGSVKITSVNGFEATIPPAEWVSIMTAMMQPKSEAEIYSTLYALHYHC